MSQETALAAACGLYCGDCEYLGNRCTGCAQLQGKPFWAGQYGVEVCPIYGCCVDQKGLEHCGLCDEFPCETFTSLRDPSMTDEQFERSLRERQENLNLRKGVGTKS